MKKTCYNCAHFHGCLAEEDPSQYHIHDYCDVFDRVLPFDMDSEVNSFLDHYWHTMCKASVGCSYGVNDDYETGEAYCWLFQELKEAFWPDERFEEYKKHNRELAIKTLEYMFNEDMVWDEFEDGTWYKLADYFDENEISELKDLLERLKIEDGR